MLNTTTAVSKAIRLVPHSKFFVSEPSPLWFGNPQNPKPLPSTWTNENWLKSRFHFAFAEYRAGNKNSQFGVIRVLNDDLVQPQRGFGAHPHHNMEIVTYVVEGELTHEDSMGTQETIHRGSIQFMTAGTGVEHSEHNIHETKPCRFIQTWITPRAQELEPNYGSLCVSSSSPTSPSFKECYENRHNKWAQLCSDTLNTTTSTPVKINQDCNLFVLEADSGGVAVQVPLPSLSIGQNRQAYIVCLEGSTQVKATTQSNNNRNNNDQVIDIGVIDMVRHDGAEVIGPVQLNLQAGSEGCHVMVFEMAYSPQHHGRTDF